MLKLAKKLSLCIAIFEIILTSQKWVECAGRINAVKIRNLEDQLGYDALQTKILEKKISIICFLYRGQKIREEMDMKKLSKKMLPLRLTIRVFHTFLNWIFIYHV